MDPDAALAELVDIAREVQVELEDESLNNHADTGALADGFLALHEWLQAGGFLPAAWRHGAAASEHGGE